MPAIKPTAQTSNLKNPPSIAMPRGNYYGLLIGYTNVWQRPKYENKNEKVDVLTLSFLVTHDAAMQPLEHYARVSKIVENKITFWEKNNQGSALAEFYSILEGLDCHELVKAIDSGAEEYIPNLDDYIAYPMALTLESKVTQAKPEDGGYAYEINQIKGWMPAPQQFIEEVQGALNSGNLVVKDSKDGRRYLAEPRNATLEFIIDGGRVVDIAAPSPQLSAQAMEIVKKHTPAVLAAPGQAQTQATGTFGKPAGGGFGRTAAATTAQAAPAQAQPAAQSNVRQFGRPPAATNAAPPPRGFGNRPPTQQQPPAQGTGDTNYTWTELEGEVPF